MITNEDTGTRLCRPCKAEVTGSNPVFSIRLNPLNDGRYVPVIKPVYYRRLMVGEMVDRVDVMERSGLYENVLPYQERIVTLRAATRYG